MKRIILAVFILINLAFGDYLADGYKVYDNGDYKKALELFKKSCDVGNTWGCAALGAIYTQG